MRLVRSRRRTRARRPFHRQHPASMRQPLQMRHHVRQRAHVRWLFLHPDKIPRIPIAIQLRCQLRLRKGIQLLHQNNRGRIVLPPFPLRDQFMPDLPAAQQYPRRRSIPAVGNHILKSRCSQILDRRTRHRIPQHALRRKHDQRLPPLPQRLPPQQMKILRRGRGLAHLHIVPRRQLQKSLNPRAGMFRPLPFITVWQ